MLESVLMSFPTEGSLPSEVIVPNRRDLLKVLLAELDLLKVRLDAVVLDTLGNDKLSTVRTPGNENLCSSCAELLGDFIHNGMLSQFGLASHYVIFECCSVQ